MANHQFQNKSQLRFVLKPINKELKILEIEASFQKAHKPNNTSNNNTSVIPTFNTDQCFFTPAFILTIDKNYYIHNEAFQKCEFQEKVERSLKPFSGNESHKQCVSIELAEPNSRYCQICKQSFSNYLSHISSITHGKAAKNSSINLEIEQLCQQFQGKQSYSTCKTKKKGIKKEGNRPKKLNQSKQAASKKISSLQFGNKSHNCSTQANQIF